MFNFLKKDESEGNITRGWPELPDRVDHNWELLLSSYAEPVKDLSKVDLSKLPISTVQKITLGVTTYLWKCTITGDTKTEEMLGSNKDTLEDILNNVNQYGQKIIKNSAGHSFIIDRYFDPNELTNLTVRKA